VKFSNTLIVENHRDFFPKSEKEMYLSGQPLHVLAMHLVRRFRRAFGDRFPISFSAGIERANFPDAVALGLTPITACSDLLRPGGYARPFGYFEELARRMDAVGATNVDEYIVRAYDNAGRGAGWPGAVEGHRPAAPGDPPFRRAVSEAKLRNTETYVERVTADPRYTAPRNSKPPRKIGSTLRLFDCITCDKCVPVCPNDANFTLVLARAEIPIIKLSKAGGKWRARQYGALVLKEKHQIGNFADFCNDCGNCDVFCPEDGGPYVLKPRFFVSRERWAAPPPRDGFCLGRRNGSESVWGRFAGAEYSLETAAGGVRYAGPGFSVAFAEADPVGTVEGDASGDVDLTYFEIMNRLRAALFAATDVNYVNSYW
jgi:putative selenate reductase